MLSGVVIAGVEFIQAVLFGGELGEVFVGVRAKQNSGQGEAIVGDEGVACFLGEEGDLIT
jgi:hypothetical protein